MQIYRLFEIVYLLLDRDNITAKDLAAHFEVSTRTIYRDIDTLCQAGIPIYTAKGKGGGIRLMEGFVLNKSFLTEKEKDEILFALQSVNAANYPGGDETLAKVTALFGTAERNWIEIDFSDWGDSHKDEFLLLKAAILHRQVVSFQYFNSSGEKSQRLVEPLQLYFRGKAWYLRGYCRIKNGPRTFKINRIKDLSLSGEAFSGDRHRFLLSFESTPPPQSFVTIKLKIHPSQAYRIYDLFPESNITLMEDGSFLATDTYPQDEWVIGMILSYGCYAEVLEPPYLRDMIRDRLEKALALYGSTELTPQGK